jgi:hypothetical protein
VLLISKDPIGYGSTRTSMGLIASCGLEEPDDNPEAFYDDLLAGGDHLNSPKVARAMADEARMSPAIAEGLALLFRRAAFPPTRSPRPPAVRAFRSTPRYVLDVANRSEMIISARFISSCLRLSESDFVRV